MMTTDGNANDDRAQLLPVRVESTWKQVIDVYRSGIMADWYVPLLTLTTILLLMLNTRANHQFRYRWLFPLKKRMKRPEDLARSYHGTCSVNKSVYRGSDLPRASITFML